ncbi:hypothetical protein AAFF_G00334250, partial [Aldrovandia affinis]
MFVSACHGKERNPFITGTINANDNSKHRSRPARVRGQYFCDRRTKTNSVPERGWRMTARPGLQLPACPAGGAVRPQAACHALPGPAPHHALERPHLGRGEEENLHPQHHWP